VKAPYFLATYSGTQTLVRPDSQSIELQDSECFDHGEMFYKSGSNVCLCGFVMGIDDGDKIHFMTFLGIHYEDS